MQEAEPLERGFGARAGAFFRSVLEGHGIEIVSADEIARFESASGATEGDGERVAPRRHRAAAARSRRTRSSAASAPSPTSCSRGAPG